MYLSAKILSELVSIGSEPEEKPTSRIQHLQPREKTQILEVLKAMRTKLIPSRDEHEHKKISPNKKVAHPEYCLNHFKNDAVNTKHLSKICGTWPSWPDF